MVTSSPFSMHPKGHTIFRPSPGPCLFQGKPHAETSMTSASAVVAHSRNPDGDSFTLNSNRTQQLAPSALNAEIEAELKAWDAINQQLQAHPHSIVHMDIEGQIHLDTTPPAVNNNKPDQTPTNNPLIRLAANPQKHIRANRHFVLVESRTSSAEKPRYLILPRPPEDKETAPYMEMRDFLSRARKEEKIGLVEFLNELRPYNGAQKECYWANNGHHRHVPYLHVHFTPLQKMNP